ncbi:MAG TPA: hypothetical protein VMS17_22780 [Gemmataceae bacterium]|nr:hypothetical protein [Gemmataceae bacterium]
MRFPFLSRRVQMQAAPPAEQPAALPPRRKRRRAATSMEYVFVASLILVVVIAGLHTFGISVNRLFSANAAATSHAQPPAPP